MTFLPFAFCISAGVQQNICTHQKVFLPPANGGRLDVRVEREYVTEDDGRRAATVAMKIAYVKTLYVYFNLSELLMSAGGLTQPEVSLT